MSISLPFKIILDQKIPMRDGVNLSASIYLPQNNEPSPVLLLITPYNVDRNHFQAKFFAQNNFPVVLVDCRGRGNSEGFFKPLSFDDSKDAYDVCLWISTQSWCNGKIGMFGGSYLGMLQWLTIKEMPPWLKTIIPTSSVCPGVDFPMKNNIFYTYLAPYLCFINAKTVNNNLFSDTDFWKNFYLNYYSGNYSFSELLKTFLIDNSSFYEWLDHPFFDDYWKNILPSDENFMNLNIPVLTISGYFDDDQTGAFYYLMKHLENNPIFANENHFLILGPWDHAGTREPKSTMGNQIFGNNSLLNINQIHLDWFNWILKGFSRPSYLSDNLIFYLLNENSWYNLPNISYLHHEEKITFYLLNDFKLSLSYSENLNLTSNQPCSIFVNPRKKYLNKSDLELNCSYNYAYCDYEPVNDESELIFTSSQIEHDIIIGGKITLSLAIKSNLESFDLEFLLFDSYKNNIQFLTRDFLRFEKKNDKEYEFVYNDHNDCFYVISFKSANYIFKKLYAGSQLILIIRNLNSPVFQNNYCSAGNKAFETITNSNSGYIYILIDKHQFTKLSVPYLTHINQNEKL